MYINKNKLTLQKNFSQIQSIVLAAVKTNVPKKLRFERQSLREEDIKEENIRHGEGVIGEWKKRKRRRK